MGLHHRVQEEWQHLRINCPAPTPTSKFPALLSCGVNTSSPRLQAREHPNHAKTVTHNPYSQYTHNPTTNTELLGHIIIHDDHGGCSIRRGGSACGRGCGCLRVLATSTSCQCGHKLENKRQDIQDTWVCSEYLRNEQTSLPNLMERTCLKR